MDFVALDVETANPDLASICEIGLSIVRGGAVVEGWSTLVNPDDYFDEVNFAIHGITEEDVAGAPSFPDALSQFALKAGSSVVVSHTSFDRTAMSLAAARHGIPGVPCNWLDSARIVRRAWPERYRVRGYGLANVANDLGIRFKHHSAAEDARAAAEIVLQAGRDTGLGIQGWIERTMLPIDPESSGTSVERSGSPDGPLYGEVLVFTGALDLPRRVAADLAAVAGCRVDQGVTKKTTILVVGDQDVGRLAGHAKSSKHRKAEELIKKGGRIRILRESDFRQLVADDA